MNDLARFVVFMVAASFVFLAVLVLALHNRTNKPNPAILYTLTFVVVVCGMLFARYAHILFRPPWWIYYGLPALTTFFLPLFVLRMKAPEIARYIPLAVLMAPAIHIFFSVFVGWHDYMPFPVYIPSLMELLHRLA
jgi:hypothetical protein